MFPLQHIRKLILMTCFYVKYGITSTIFMLWKIYWYQKKQKIKASKKIKEFFSAPFVILNKLVNMLKKYTSN